MRRVLVIALGLIVALILGLRLMAAFRETADGTPPDLGRLIATPMGAIYIEEAGPPTGTPVLLAHGSVGWARMWQPTQTALAAQGYHAIAIDMPPMGYSDRDPQADYSRQTQARRLLALTQALQIKPILVAHSFGAGAAAEAAMLDPQAFDGLIVVDGAIGLNAPAKEMPLPLRPLWLRELVISATVTNPLMSGPLLKTFLYRKDVVTPDLLDMLRQPSLRQGSTAELARWLPALLVPPTGALSTTDQGWRDLPLPVIFLWGDRDTVTPLDQGETLATLTGGPLIILPETGHIPQIEAPQAFNTALLQALQSLGH